MAGIFGAALTLTMIQSRQTYGFWSYGLTRTRRDSMICEWAPGWPFLVRFSASTITVRWSKR